MPVLKNEASLSPAIGFIKYWLPVLIYATIIFYLSSLPGKEIPQVFAYQDKLAHIGEYFGFALLLNRAFRAYGLGSVRARFWAVLSICVLYAFSDEFHQMFVPHRNASLLDVLADGFGASAAGLFYAWRK